MAGIFNVCIFLNQTLPHLYATSNLDILQSCQFYACFCSLEVQLHISQFHIYIESSWICQNYYAFMCHLIWHFCSYFYFCVRNYDKNIIGKYLLKTSCEFRCYIRKDYVLKQKHISVNKKTWGPVAVWLPWCKSLSVDEHMQLLLAVLHAIVT